MGPHVVQGELDEQHTAAVPDGHHSLRPHQQLHSGLLADASLEVTTVKSPAGELEQYLDCFNLENPLLTSEPYIEYFSSSQLLNTRDDAIDDLFSHLSCPLYSGFSRRRH